MKAIAKFSCLIAAISLFTCADTYKWPNRVEPRLLINGVDDRFSLVDSIKVRHKTNNGTSGRYTFSLTGTGTVPKSIITDKISGGTLSIEGTPVRQGAEVPLSKDKPKVNCSFEPLPDTEATCELVFRMKDLGSEVGRITYIKIIAFKNLLPVVNLSVTHVSGNKYTLDATKSYDRDRSQGGGIETFTYTVTGPENRTFTTSKALFTYGFPLTGAYKVTLVARDNDADDSAPVSIIVNVN